MSENIGTPKHDSEQDRESTSAESAMGHGIDGAVEADASAAPDETDPAGVQGSDADFNV